MNLLNNTVPNSPLSIFIPHSRFNQGQQNQLSSNKVSNVGTAILANDPHNFKDQSSIEEYLLRKDSRNTKKNIPVDKYVGIRPQNNLRLDTTQKVFELLSPIPEEDLSIQES